MGRWSDVFRSSISCTVQDRGCHRGSPYIQQHIINSCPWHSMHVGVTWTSHYLTLAVRQHTTHISSSVHLEEPPEHLGQCYNRTVDTHWWTQVGIKVTHHNHWTKCLRFKSMCFMKKLLPFNLSTKVRAIHNAPSWLSGYYTLFLLTILLSVCLLSGAWFACNLCMTLLISLFIRIW